MQYSSMNHDVALYEITIILCKNYSNYRKICGICFNHFGLRTREVVFSTIGKLTTYRTNHIVALEQSLC